MLEKPKRRKISGTVWIILALMLSVASYIINGNSMTGKFSFFLIIALIIFLYGVAILLFRKKPKHEFDYRIKPEKVKTEFGKPEKPRPYGGSYCGNCGSVLMPQDNFCRSCGARRL